jgi:protein O-mannosyl-transferase
VIKPRVDFWISLALFALPLAVYFQVRTFDFVNYDDPDYVTNNEHVRHGLTGDGLVWALTSGDAANWFPVTRISHMLDVLVFGMESGGHHFTGALIHALATLLLFAFLHLATGDRWPSAAVALIFAVHPLHVESVAWVSERKDVLCAFFWFFTLWAYVRYARRPSLSRYTVAVAGFCLGLMSKPMIVTLPFVLLLLDFWPLRRAVSLREKIPFFALSAISAAITVLVQKGSGAVESLATVPPAMRVENALVSYVVYMAKTVWPSHLAVFYPYPADIPLWQPVLAGLGILVVSGMAWIGFRKQPWLAAGWLWFLITLLPVIGLVQVGSQARADRYMYVPMVGLLIMLAWSLAAALRKRAGAMMAAAAVACACCVPVTWEQTGYWRNSETLFEHALAVTRGNSVAEHNVGSYLLDTPGRLPEAIAHLQAAARITPGSAPIHSDLATALAKSGRLPEAIQEYQAALRLNPEAAIVHNNLANALQQAGRLPEAVTEYQFALRLNPDYSDARQNLANALRTPAADSAEAHYGVGIDLAHAGRLDQAIAEFQTALRLRPAYAEAENNLGVALTQAPGREAEALKHFEAAVRLNPGYADARFNLGVALSQIPGRMHEAISQLEAAYRLHPDPELRQTLDRLRAGR